MDFSGKQVFMDKYVNCHLCGSEKAKIFHRFKVDDRVCTLVKCLNCGLIYMNPRPDEIGLRDLYGEDYYIRHDPETGYKSYIGKRSYLLKTFDELLSEVERYKKGGKILDIGCAAGFFLEIAKSRGWEPYGVEISDFSSRYAREKIGLYIYTGTLVQARFPNDFFDAITMFETIEHFPNPLSELNEVKRILRKNGILAIKAPNAGCYKARWNKNNFEALNIPYHLCHFTPKTLKRLLKKAGLSILRCETNITLINMNTLGRLGLPADEKTKERLLKYLSGPKRIIRYLTGKLLQGPTIRMYATKY